MRRLLFLPSSINPFQNGTVQIYFLVLFFCLICNKTSVFSLLVVCNDKKEYLYVIILLSLLFFIIRCINQFVSIILYRITGNFCGVKFLRFWSKKKTFNFCGSKISVPKKKLFVYRKEQLKRCYDKQLVHITMVIRSKNI